MLPSDTPIEFDLDRPMWNSRDSRDSAGTTNYLIAFSQGVTPHPEFSFAIHWIQGAGRRTVEFGSLNEDTVSSFPENNPIQAPVSRIDDRDFSWGKENAYDYPLGVENDDDELCLGEPGTWDIFDNQVWFDDDHWAEVDSRESGKDGGFHPTGTSFGQYFDFKEIFDQEDMEMSVYEEKEEEYDVRNDFVKMGEEFRPRGNVWSFYGENEPLGASTSSPPFNL